MNIQNQPIKVSGEKIECLVVGENSIQLADKAFSSIEEFNETWNKTMTLVSKSEIKYESIKSISKEENEDEVVVKASGAMGIPSETKFAFVNNSNKDAFFNFFQGQKSFIRTDDTLSPMKSAMPYIWGLLASIAISSYAFFEAMSMNAGTFVATEGNSRGARKSRFFDSIIEMLGTNGVLLLGLGASAFIGYLAWKRFKNPPMQTKLVPNK